MARRPDREGRLDDHPPFFRTWGGVYAVVLGWLALLVALFRLLTVWFR